MDTDIFRAIIVANVLTASAIYGLWRVSKNERDTKGIIWLVSAGLIVALISY